MAVQLHIESVDDEPELLMFSDMELAIGYAKNWFRDGYDNDSIPETTRADLPNDLEDMEKSLRAGQEYHCGRFHETVRITDLEA